MHWSKASLVFLFVVALVGTILRSVAYLPIPFEYANLVHAHSHVAFQGWIYTLMLLLLVRYFLSGDQIIAGKYLLQFQLTVVVIVGVLITFSIQGYGLYSIIFSTLFQILNYWFIFRFFRDSRTKSKEKLVNIPLRFVNSGLLLGLISTLLPIAIGISAAKGLKGSELYDSLVYTFLHLQYNGWFLFVVLGLFYRFLEKNKINFNNKHATRFYWCFAISVIPAIALSLLGMSFSVKLDLIAYASAIAQGIGLAYFLRSLPADLHKKLRTKIWWIRSYLLSFIVFFCIKVVLQSLSVLPSLREYAFTNKNIILAYLHLSLIGVVSFLFLALMMELKWVLNDPRSRTGNALLFFGFLVTELMLLLSGLEVYQNQILLIIGSGFMTLGILLLIISRPDNSFKYGKI